MKVLLYYNKTNKSKEINDKQQVKLLGMPNGDNGRGGGDTIRWFGNNSNKYGRGGRWLIVATTIMDGHHNASISKLQPKVKAFILTSALDDSYISYKIVYDLNV